MPDWIQHIAAFGKEGDAQENDTSEEDSENEEGGVDVQKEFHVVLGTSVF
jgi:hypothetical protein